METLTYDDTGCIKLEKTGNTIYLYNYNKSAFNFHAILVQKAPIASPRSRLSAGDYFIHN